MQTNDPRPGRQRPQDRREAACAALAACVVVLAAGCQSHGVCTGTPLAPIPAPVPAAAPVASLAERWGIDIASLRMSGNGHLIDFRYRVHDPAKAALLADVRYTPVMIDQATGTKLKIPNTPKLGPLRQSTARLESGKIYFMLFANSGRLVKAGSKVTVEIGDFRVENLSVE